MKKEYSDTAWDDYPEAKTYIGNPKQCGVFDVQMDGTVKTMFLSDDNGAHVNLLQDMP